MSTIVVVKKNGEIAIAADTLTKYGSMKMRDAYRVDAGKILRFGDTFVGIVGPTVHMDVFASAVAKYPEKVSFAGRTAIFDTYVALHPVLKHEYFLNSAPDAGDEYESSQIEALIANPNGIFGMCSWRTVVEYERFFATGSGREFALGAMHAVYDHGEAYDVALAGVAAAAEFDDSTAGPFTIHAFATNEAGTLAEALAD
jgi:ATP-dependent HslUV protease, peptidase subunit HslV